MKISEPSARKNSLVWHSLSTPHIMKVLDAQHTGLSKAEAVQRLQEYGYNRLPEVTKRSPWIRFLAQFHNVLIYVLIGAALITTFLNHWIDTCVILAVIFVNALISFVQEGKAEKEIEAIRYMLAPHANVLRDGVRLSIEAEEVVPGDIVLLEPGDKVPADLRLLSSYGLSIQEAILTGESVASEKHVEPLAIDTQIGDRSCMAFSGTLVTAGHAKGVAVATGHNSEINRISSLLSEVEVLTTPLVSQMGVFARWLTVFILLISGMLLLYGYFVERYDFTALFMAVVGLSVAAIPEGLPAVLTITLAVGVQEMARRNAIMRRLPAIETLGSVSVICTDKTGTLTRNEMMVTSALTQQHLFTLTGNGYEPKGDVKLEDSSVVLSQHKVLAELARAAILCNDADLRKEGEVWKVEGDPMEGALLTFAGKMNVDIYDERKTWSRTDALPFDVKHRFMATLNNDQLNPGYIFVKGAPEAVLSMCRDQRREDGKTELLDQKYWRQGAEKIAAQGQRVLAFAVKHVVAQDEGLNPSDLEDRLTMLGMVGMIDPPRPEAITAVAECHDAGIRVKMITGDHAQTAAAIGKEIGLQNTDKILTGADLDSMDDASLRQAVLECDIFARTSPEHKLRLVMALQSHHMTVAMTGDGVNDAPALKRADAGIAMGKKGSEAAKEASELVLADDNFASIVVAVREGRTVYDNIKKVISWTLPTNAGEAMIIVVALIFGFSLPISPIQILWINLITAVTLGIALAFEPTEANTMRRLPHSRHEALLSGELAWHILLVSFLFLCGVYGMFTYAIDRGYSIELARTIVVNTLVVMEIFHLFFIRNIYGTSLTWKAVRGTKVVWATIIIVTVGQFAITYLPALQAIFDTRAIPFGDGVLIIGVGMAMFALIETEKQIRLAFRQKNLGS